MEKRRKMGYWKSKVLPRIKKVFEKNGTKKAAAAEACKSFDDSKVVFMYMYICVLFLIYFACCLINNYVELAIYARFVGTNQKRV